VLLKNWPLFGLRVVTPRLTLVVPTDQQLDDLIGLALRGIHPPDEMPFGSPWTLIEPPEFQRQFLQFHWRHRADWSAIRWNLPMAVVVEGEVAGTQELAAVDFPVMSEVATGSWLGLSFQGRGIGKEMRRAILYLAFAGLGAHAAHSRAHEDNVRSLRVTRALGYAPNGEIVEAPVGIPVRTLCYRLARNVWEASRPRDIKIEGLENCREMFGV